jgi:hypothetical protein
MIRSCLHRVVLWTTLALLAVAWAGAGHPVAGQDSEQDAKPAAAQKAKKFRGRLPAHFGRVVSQQQRQAIYKIQEEYWPKISALKEQLAALTNERDEKVRALLTPEQAKKIDELKAAAAAKRRQKRSAGQEPAAQEPSQKAPNDSAAK